MQSAFVWWSLVVALLAVLLVLVIVLVLRKPRGDTDPARPPAAMPADPLPGHPARPDQTRGFPVSSPVPPGELFTPARPAAADPPPRGFPVSSPTPPEELFTPARPPAPGGEQLFTPARPVPPAGSNGGAARPPARTWPTVGVRELAAASRQIAQPVLRGTVRGDDGTLLADAVLTVINVTGGQAGSSRTGADGTYELAIPAEGGYVLIARGVNHEPHASTVTVNGPVTTCDIKLTSAAGLMGAVCDADGSPIAGATVILTNTNGAVVSAQRTNVQGGYTVDDLTPGLYTVTATAPGQEPVAMLVDVPPTGVVRQNVAFPPRRLGLRGVARHRVDGRPLADVRVRLLDASGAVVATTGTGPDGRYEFADLAAGRYTVAASGYPEVTGSLDLGDTAGEYEVRLGHADLPPGSALVPVSAPDALLDNGTADEEHRR